MVRFTIPLPPVTKKNSQQIFRGKNGKPFIVPSKKYREYQDAAAAFCPKTRIEGPVAIKCLFFMPTRRRVDLTNLLEALDDVLVYAGTLEDDNCLVIPSHDGSRVILGDKSPRTEVEIERF